MPRGLFRLGLFGWSERPSIGRFALGVGVAVMLVPVLLGLLFITAVANLPLPGGPGLKPMASWQVSQPFGCSGFVYEPQRGDCLHFHSGVALAGRAVGAVYSELPGLFEVVSP